MTCAGARPWLLDVTTLRDVVGQDDFIERRASSLDFAACPLKPRCRPDTPERKVSRPIHEGARDMARDFTASEAFAVSSTLRRTIGMFFAHLERIPGLHRLRLRDPNGASDEFHLAAAHNLRRLAKLTARSRATSPA